MVNKRFTNQRRCRQSPRGQLLAK